MLKIILFASLRDLVGRSEVELDLTDEGTTVREVFNRLEVQFPELKRYEPILLIAVNQEYTGWEQSVRAGDEIAFFPPVSGGGS